MHFPEETGGIGTVGRFTVGAVGGGTVGANFKAQAHVALEPVESEQRSARQLNRLRSHGHTQDPPNTLQLDDAGRFGIGMHCPVGVGAAGAVTVGAAGTGTGTVGAILTAQAHVALDPLESVTHQAPAAGVVGSGGSFPSAM